MTRTLANLCEAAGINLMSVNPTPRFADWVGRATWATFTHDSLGAWVERSFSAHTETVMITSSQFVTLRLAGVQMDTPLHLDSLV